MRLFKTAAWTEMSLPSTPATCQKAAALSALGLASSPENDALAALGFTPRQLDNQDTLDEKAKGQECMTPSVEKASPSQMKDALGKLGLEVSSRATTPAAKRMVTPQLPQSSSNPEERAIAAAARRAAFLAAEKEKERPAPPKYKVRDHLRFQIQIIPS